LASQRKNSPSRSEAWKSSCTHHSSRSAIEELLLNFTLIGTLQQLSANGTVKIGDFGLSQRLGEIKNIGGTLNYMAPEVFDGNVSEKTDVYAFGL
jgi:hypothetical protein